MVKTSFFQKLAIGLLFIISILIMQGCSSNYEFGDISKRIDSTSRNYCTATNPESRAMLKMTLNSLGVNIGVDFCTAYGLKTILVGESNG